MSTSTKSILKDMSMLLIILSVFYIAFLGSRPLSNPDEGRYPEVAREMVKTGDFLTPTINTVPFFDKPALYYWFEAGSMKLFGINTWAIRLPQALFAILGALMVYFFARKLYDRKTGLCAAGILATSPIYFFSGHYANLDLEVAIWVSASLLSFIYSTTLDKDKMRRYIMWFAYACSALAFLTKGLMGIVFPIMVIGAWISWLNRWSYLKKMSLFSGLIIWLVIAAPWFILMHLKHPNFLNYFFYFQQFVRFTQGGFNNPFPFYFYPIILLVGLLPWSFYAVPGLKHTVSTLIQNRKQAPQTLFLGLWVILITIFFSIPESKIVGYILPVVPALSILIARYFITIPFNQLSAKIANHISSTILVLIGIALLVVPFFVDDLNPDQILPLFIPAGITMLVCGFLAFYFTKKKQANKLFITLLISMGLFSWLGVLSIPKVDNNTQYPLAAAVLKDLKPEDKLMAYDDYYQDLPIYLQRTMYVAYHWHDMNDNAPDNWAKDFYLGMSRNPGSYPLMVDYGMFKTLWDAAGQVYIFTPDYRYRDFKKDYGNEIEFVKEHRGNVVFRKSSKKLQDEP